MSAYMYEIKEYIDRYRREVRDDGLIDPHDLAAWAYGNGLQKPTVRTIIDAIAADISQVFREEYRTAPDGRRYRAKHAATQKQGNKTLALWADLDDPTAPHQHFVRSFGQRRQQIVRTVLRRGASARTSSTGARLDRDGDEGLTSLSSALDRVGYQLAEHEGGDHSAPPGACWARMSGSAAMTASTTRA